MNRKQMLRLLLRLRRRGRRRRRHRRFRVRDIWRRRKSEVGEYNLFTEIHGRNHESFARYCRTSPALFGHILSMLKPAMSEDGSDQKTLIGYRHIRTNSKNGNRCYCNGTAATADFRQRDNGFLIRIRRVIFTARTEFLRNMKVCNVERYGRTIRFKVPKRNDARTQRILADCAKSFFFFSYNTVIG